MEINEEESELVEIRQLDKNKWEGSKENEPLLKVWLVLDWGRWNKVEESI